MTQYGRPESDITVTNWTRSSGTANYCTYLDEASADDADYVYTQTQAAPLEVKLSTITDPAGNTGHVVRFRYYCLGATAGEKQTVILVENTTTRATIVNNLTMTRDAWTQVDYTLSSAEADAITNYTDLRLRFTAGTLGAGETYRISWAVMETPDAPARSVNVSDALAIGESVSAQRTGGTLTPNVTDGLTVGESANVLIAEPASGEWSDYRIALPPGVADSWDEVLWGGGSGQPIKVGDTYYFYYCGSQDPDNGDVYRSIGLATSKNFLTWTKHPSNPLITYTTTGNVETEEGASNPTVLYDAGTWHMWYAASRYTAPATVDIDIRYRTSTDGVTWTGDAEVYRVNGEEYLPIGAVKIGSTFYLYILGNLSAGTGNLNVIYGNTANALSNFTLVQSGTFRSSHSLNDLNDGTLSLALALTNWDKAFYRINRSTPTVISSQISTYSAAGKTLFEMLRDSSFAYRWRSLEMGGAGGEFVYRHSPIGTIETDGNEAVAVGESVTVQFEAGATLAVSASDGITTGDYVGFLSSIVVGESVTVTLADLTINQSDAIAVGETVDISIQAEEAFVVNVSDALAVNEAVTVTLPDDLAVDQSDAIAVSETVIVTLPDDLAVSQSDAITVGEAVTVVLDDLIISKSDSLAIGEAVAVTLPDDLVISQSDNLAVGEVVTLAFDDLIITHTDALTVGESVSVTLPDDLTITQADAIVVGEVVTLAIDDLLISQADAIVVGEAVDVFLPEIGMITVDVSDALVVGESVSVTLDDLAVSKSDAISVGETVTIALGDLVVTETDALSVGESVAVTLPDDLAVTKTDALSVGESVTITLDDLTISQADALAVGEDVTVSLPEIGTVEVAASDALVVGESVTVTLDDLTISLANAIAVGEAVTVTMPDNLAITQTDALSVGEVVTVTLDDLTITKTDALTIGESVTATLDDLAITQADALAVSEAVNVSLLEVGAIDVSVSDSLSVGESVTVTLDDLTISQADAVTVDDSGTAVISDLVISTSDGIAIGENNALVVSINISVSDGIAVGDSVGASLADALFVNVADALAVGDSRNVWIEGEAWQVNVSDGVRVGESLAKHLFAPTVPDRSLLVNAEVREYYIEQEVRKYLIYQDERTASL